MSTSTVPTSEAGAPSPSGRPALDAWLRAADEVLASQRAYSISPSFVQALVTDQPYRSVVTMGDLEVGLPVMLDRLAQAPGRWVLILEAAHRYVQFMLYEDGSVVAEAVSNTYLRDPHRLAETDEARLATLGWRAPTVRCPNWRLVEPTASPDTDFVANVAMSALRTVFGANDGDQVLVKMFSLRKRGRTPTDPYRLRPQKQ